ncbi:uncharacterized protein BJ212DRAFT_1244676, partial [Suillus subaureus]
ELNYLATLFAQLKQAQAKFKSRIENVGDKTKVHQRVIIFVPLTNSLYVPGHLSDADHI